MNLARVAHRNLRRNRARTALSVVAVSVGVFVVVLAKGMIDGSIAMIEGNAIRFASGHVRVIASEYRVKERLLSLNYTVDGFNGEGYQALVEALERADGVGEVVPRLRFGAMVSREARPHALLGMGVVPASEEKQMRISRYLTEGRFLRDVGREAFMGEVTLTRLGINVGDKVTMVFTTASGSLRAYTFTVVGTMRSGIAYLDDGLVLVPLGVAQEMLDMGPAVTELLVMAERGGQAPEVLGAIRDVIESRGASDRYLAVPWYQQSGYMSNLHLMKGACHIIYAFILALASLAVVNTMVMIVNERRREIGMMTALGARPREVLGLFLVEGGLMGALGSLAGTLAGSLVVKVLSVKGIPLWGGSDVDKRIMMAPRLFAEFNAGVLAYAFLAGVAVAVAASYLPARQAAQIKPTQALRM